MGKSSGSSQSALSLIKMLNLSTGLNLALPCKNKNFYSGLFFSGLTSTALRFRLPVGTKAALEPGHFIFSGGFRVCFGPFCRRVVRKNGPRAFGQVAPHRYAGPRRLGVFCEPDPPPFVQSEQLVQKFVHIQSIASLACHFGVVIEEYHIPIKRFRV